MNWFYQIGEWSTLDHALWSKYLSHTTPINRALKKHRLSYVNNDFFQCMLKDGDVLSIAAMPDNAAAVDMDDVIVPVGTGTIARIVDHAPQRKKLTYNL